MPVPVLPQKNIWIAAGDGDLDAVKDLVERHGLSPNVPDPNTYTPMHAAASYGHIPVLEYLIQRGGDVNITDEDGDTPLYTVESVDVARYLVERGARLDWRNSGGLSPSEHLEEEFPEVAAFLRSLSGEAPPSNLSNLSSPSNPSEPPNPSDPPNLNLPSNLATDTASEQLTRTLLADVHAIMQRAELEGRDPEEELREVVGRAVVSGMVMGRAWDVQVGANEDEDEDRDGGEGRSGEGEGDKRARTGE